MISAQDPPSTFWVTWLTVVAAGVSVFGLALVLLAIPLLATRKSFSGKQA